MVNYNLLIQVTFKNVFINVYDQYGKTLIFLTAGQVGFNGKQKKSPIALQFVIYRLIKLLRKKKIKSVNLFLKNTTRVHRRILKFLNKANLEISTFTEQTPTVHNGCRQTRRKRK